MKNIIIGLFIYISTGILQPILIDTLRHNNCLGHKHLLLPTLANTTGMALCGILASKSQWESLISLLLKPQSSPSNGILKMIIITSIVDLCSGMLLTFGILITGGAIFVILYNSCPVWTALLSRIMLHKKLSYLSFIGVLCVCIGLVVNVLGTSKLHIEHDWNGGVVIGSVIVLIGSLLHSLMFVLSDMTLRGVTNTNAIDEVTSNDDERSSFIPPSSTMEISGIIWSCCLGTIEASFMTVWVFIGILLYGFHGNDTITKPNISTIILGLLILIVINAAHAAAFFTLLQNIGAISSALIKGVQTVIVVLLSAIFFCGVEETQCLDVNKACSALFVIVGVFCYAGGSKVEEKAREVK